MDTILWHAGIFLGIVLLVGLLVAAAIRLVTLDANKDTSIGKRLDLLEGIARRKKRKAK